MSIIQYATATIGLFKGLNELFWKNDGSEKQNAYLKQDKSNLKDRVERSEKGSVYLKQSKKNLKDRAEILKDQNADLNQEKASLKRKHNSEKHDGEPDPKNPHLEACS
jgi:hypothetical protein